LLLRPALLAGIALCAIGAPLAAQEAPAAEPRTQAVQPGDVIDFAADTMTYSDNDQLITATGSVHINRDRNVLTADEVTYNRTTGQVEAHGNVITTDPDGNRAYGDRVVLTESLKDGAIDNILLVLKDGGRLAARSAVRVDGRSTLDHATYSPCAVEGPDGCPLTPDWQIEAVTVVHDPLRHRISYRHARLRMFGHTVLALPGFSHPDGGAPQASGLLVPDVGYRSQLGFAVGLPYNLALGPDRDVTVTPWIYTGVEPALEVRARQLLANGAVQARAFFTYAPLTIYAADGVTQLTRGNAFRGYFEANGQIQHSPEWRSTFSVRLTTDNTFNPRYGIDYDDTLRSTYAVERFRDTSYLSVRGWFFQGLRAIDRAGTTPIALPLIDYRWNPEQRVLGGKLSIVANSLALSRSDGQGIRRALAYAQWDRSIITPLGQRVTFTALARGDVYDTVDAALATLRRYAGVDGFRGRFMPQGAIDAEWPFAGPLAGGEQAITPRVQLVTAPRRLNIGIPNEDSRAVELEDVSLFALNRFPGFDRFEGGSRVTYGVQYSYSRPRFSLQTEIGQSYRFYGSQLTFPVGTGLTRPWSDIVGRTTLKYAGWLEVTHRFRLDDGNLSVHRNEADITVGSPKTYATIGYVKIANAIAIEDLPNLEELRLSARVAFARHWSVFGSTTIDLTSPTEQPGATTNGFTPVRHRAGVQYEDECFRFGVSWRRNYLSYGDFRSGNTYLLTLAFKNLGR